MLSLAERIYACLDCLRKTETFQRPAKISTKEILSIDLGKFNSVFCWFDQESKKAAFRTIPSLPDQVPLALLQKHVQTVVMETCSRAGWVSEPCNEPGLLVTVAR